MVYKILKRRDNNIPYAKGTNLPIVNSTASYCNLLNFAETLLPPPIANYGAGSICTGVVLHNVVKRAYTLCLLTTIVVIVWKYMRVLDLYFVNDLFFPVCNNCTLTV